MRFEAEAELWAARTYGVLKGFTKFVIDFLAGWRIARMENR
jgi:hypothetical protein